MNEPIDIQALRSKAEAALPVATRGVLACWPTSTKSGAYVGAAFDFADKRWVVVRGPQRPSTARLLDATAAFQHAEGAEHGLALLGPEEPPMHAPAPEQYRRRFQTAAWHGLGIVWVETAGPGAWNWEPGELPEHGDLDVLAGAVKSALLAEATPLWAKLTKSRDAEAVVCPVLTKVLADFGFKLELRPAWRFPAFWRNAECDGLWTRTGKFPSTLALEVKVSEDADAPLCQVLDDLGQFDAVLYVRLLNESTRLGMAKRAGMHEAMGKIETKLPVRYIDLPFATLGRS